VPAHITVAYVDAVLAKLNHIYGDAARSAVANKTLTIQAIEDLDAIYTPRLVATEYSVFVQTLKTDMKNIRPVPGDPITRVRKLVYTSPTCLFAKVRTNSDPAVIHPVKPAASEFVGLRSVSIGRGHGRNTTPWIFFYDAVTKTPTNIPNQCAQA
jgi:hypothetical protein